VRETENLVEQQPPQGVFVCDHAGLVINKLSLQGDSTLRHVRELIFEYTGIRLKYEPASEPLHIYTGVLQSPAGLSTPRTLCAPRVQGESTPELARPGNSLGLPGGLLFWQCLSVTFKAGCLGV